MIRTAFTVVLSAALLAGVAEPPKAQELTLEVVVTTPRLRTVPAVAERFDAERPDIAVEVSAPVTTYEELLQRTLRGALVDDLPDVIFLGYNLLGVAVNRGLGVPLDPFIAEEADWAGRGFTDAVLSACRVAGAQYCLPYETSLPIIYYNVDLVAAAGGDPNAFPTDWDAIVDLGRAIDALGDDVTGVVFPFNHSGNWGFQALVFSRGGRLMDAGETTVAFDGEEGRWALDLLARIAETSDAAFGWTDGRQAFAAGAVGIFIDTSGALTGLVDGAGGRFAVRTAPLPVAANGRLPAGGNGALILTDDPVRQAAAWDFVSFAAGAVGQTIVVNNSGYMTNNSLAIDDPDLLGRFYRDNPEHRTAVDLLPHITRWYAFPGVNSVRIAEAIEDHLLSVLSGEATPDAAMPRMVADVEALLAQD